MSDTPAVPDGAADSVADAVDDIVEVIFEDHYGMAILAFIAGALIVAGIVYIIGSRMNDPEDATNAEN